MSRAIASAEPLRTAAVTYFAATHPTNLDWRILANWGWDLDAKPRTKRPQHKTQEALTYLAATPGSHTWFPAQFERSLLLPLYGDKAIGPSQKWVLREKVPYRPAERLLAGYSMAGLPASASQ